MCSETSEAVGTNWEHAQLEVLKFLKIRIPLLSISKKHEFKQLLKGEIILPPGVGPPPPPLQFGRSRRSEDATLFAIFYAQYVVVLKIMHLWPGSRGKVANAKSAT